MFKITDNKGFQLTFANGCTISVQFGPGNYTDQDLRSLPLYTPRNNTEWQAQTAEVAIFLPSGDFYPIPPEQFSNSDGHAIVGWATVEDVCALIEFARNIQTGVTANT